MIPPGPRSILLSCRRASRPATLSSGILPLALCFVLSFIRSESLPDSACAPFAQHCGHLGDLTYPFGKKGSNCGASAEFQLSNCSQMPSTVYWDEFYGRPAVLDVNGSIPTSSLILTWASSAPSSQPCRIYSSEELPLLLPDSAGPNGLGIDLRASPDFSAFSLSPNNIFLLFNCTGAQHVNSSNYVQPNTKTCAFFKDQCSGVADGQACIQFQPQWQLDLPKAMKLSQCSHFQFLFTEDPSLPVESWKPHAVQLVWAPQDFNFHSGLLCRACEGSNGTCGYYDDGRFRCFCPNNQSSAEDCNHLTDEGSSISKGVIVALGLVAGLMAALFIATINCLCRYSRRARIFSSRSACSSSNNSVKHWPQRAQSIHSRPALTCVQEYSFREILEATSFFSDDSIIGDGGFGSVYQGKLKDGRLIAVKRLFQDNLSRTNHFYNEIQILSMVNHPNLVKFYGSCREDDRNLLLLFEYLPNGTVFDKLHHEDAAMAAGAPGGLLPWRVRIRIAMETAEALSYLHNTMKPPILHRDVKTTNILLDEDFHAKLADFGLSRSVPVELTHVSTAPQGTPGYLDPEYHSNYRLTDKSDVYSFGVVLMELVSSEKAVDFSRSDEEINLSLMALSRNQRGSWRELVDTQCWPLDADMDATMAVGEMAHLAFRCLQPSRSERPSVSDVSAALTELWLSRASLP